MTTPRYAPFVYTFWVFSTLIFFANIHAEISQNLLVARIQNSILISAFFAIPALSIFFRYPLAQSSHLALRYWQLCWIFSFVAYALHAYLSVGRWFEWDFKQISERQTSLVAISNYVLLFIWSVDIFFAFLGSSVGGRFIRILRWITHCHFLISFSLAAILFRSQSSTPYSLIFAIILLIVSFFGLLLRWSRSKQ